MKTLSIYNNFLKHSQELRDELVDLIKAHGYRTGKDGDFMFVIGGDGTFLKAMQRNIKEDPIYIGLNTGNLGFLSEFNFNNVDEIFKMLKTGRFKIQKLPIYEVVFKDRNNNTKKNFFLNDAVIERKSSRIIHSSVHINDKKFCNISGDGVILSSSVGSTGYAVSAGASISYDCDDCLQLSPISPVQSKAYQSLTKSVILKDDNEITIFPSVKKRRTFRLVLDGNEIKCENCKFVEIRKSKYTARLLRSAGFDNTDNLRDKILEEN